MMEIKPLTTEKLYRRCNPELFEFDTTAAVKIPERMVGQERAVQAIELGLELNVPGFNLFVIGPPGTGRHSFIKYYLQEKSPAAPVPSDWCYVNNFDEQHIPLAVELPAGRGRQFRDDVSRFIEESLRAIPTAFESEDYHERRRIIEEQAKEEQARAFQEVQAHAHERRLRITQTATGFEFVPLSDGEELSPKDYEQLPTDKKERLRSDTEEMAEELRKMLQAIPRKVRKVREKIEQLDREVALFAVEDLIAELVEKFHDIPKVVSYLKAMQKDITDHFDLFAPDASDTSPAGEQFKQMPGMRPSGEQFYESPAMQRYGVNLLIDHNDDKGAPVVFEDQPTHPYLMGQIEHAARMGALVTNYRLIRSGALHRANGGYLVMDARKVLTQPFAWDGLKRALKSREIDIKSPAQVYGLISTVSLEPEPIPLDIKVVLIGEREIYYLLQALDPEFNQLFKVAADFDDQMERNNDNIRQLARFLVNISQQEQLKPMNREAVARLVEESARHAGDAEMLSAQMRRVADVLREAHFWATKNHQDVIGAREVQAAIDGRIHRMSRIRDRLQRETLRETILIDTEGEVTGQINGLSVLQIGEFMFGRPTRITARLALGTGKVLDIEREVELGGPIHSKGVLILSSYLASHYEPQQPLSLLASLVFEQSYSPVEGDSASAAELCVLLSALANVPIKQSLAITGSVNQYGKIQAIGGVNQKIEGFFDICNARGLTGEQGVLIPSSNVKHLMLRADIIQAVAENRFKIFAVDTIDQCLEILTGREAGVRDLQGNFPAGSMNEDIRTALRDYAEKRRRFDLKPEEKKTLYT
jgi:lon-related putative ATP-dependent protease